MGTEESEVDEFTRHHLVLTELVERLPSVRDDREAFAFACAELHKHVTKLEELGPRA
ncbi:MAG: hypothetical protein M3203_09400 [Actinomycetota bacterium]|nr:hypothetical protein [Actinomycetota bacterium]